MSKTRYRVLHRWFRKPVLVLQKLVENHVPQNESGRVTITPYKKWIDVEPEELLELSTKESPVFKTVNKSGDQQCT